MLNDGSIEPHLEQNPGYVSMSFLKSISYLSITGLKQNKYIDNLKLDGVSHEKFRHMHVQEAYSTLFFT